MTNPTSRLGLRSLILLAAMVFPLTGATSAAQVHSAPALLPRPLQAAGQSGTAANQGAIRQLFPLVMTPALPPTSFDLIDRALAAGTITAETALIDKVYAAFADLRLPAQFQGTVTRGRDTGIIRQVQAQYAGLSPAAQAILAPFLLPPAYTGSWAISNASPSAPALSPQADAALSPDWATVNSKNGKVKVWWHNTRYPGDRAKAQSIADAMDALIWSKLTTLMGKEPLSDSGKANNGGDGRLDIYLVRMGAGDDGETDTYDDPCTDASYILINHSLGDNLLLASTAHEFMHVLQNAYKVKDCKDYDWLAEATATWAEDYVYGTPDYQTEQEYLKDFLDVPETPLEDTTGLHEYGAYLLPFYISHKYSADRIHQMWVQSESNASSLAAVDAALAGDGGLATVWPQFALRNWNTAPVDDYHTWDGVTRQAILTQDNPVLLLSPGVSYKMNEEVKHLSARYYHFTFPDDTARSVAFYNAPRWLKLPGGTVDPAAHVWALLKIGGAWQAPQDWTTLTGKGFCRDKSDERLQELVLIISNSEFQDRTHSLHPSDAPKLNVTNIGCWRWTGTSTGTYVTKGFWTMTTQAQQVVFERFESPGLNGLDTNYRTVSGSVVWQMGGAASGCTFSGGPTTVPVLNSAGTLSINNFTVGNSQARTYSGFGASSNTFHYTVTCNGSSSINPWIGSSWFGALGPKVYQVSDDGQTLDDSSTTEDDSQHSQTYRWRFTAQRQP